MAAATNAAANSQRQGGSSSKAQAAQQVQLSAAAANDEQLVRLVYQVVYECVCLRCWAFEGKDRFDLHPNKSELRLPIVSLLELISGALEARDADAFEKLLRAGREKLLRESSALHHMSYAVPVNPTPLQSAAAAAAGNGGGGATMPFAPSQQQMIQQAHLTNGRQTPFTLAQQNGSPSLATSVIAPTARTGGTPDLSNSPTQDTQDSAVRVGNQ